MTIDSHQHFWKYDPARHSWINDDMAVLKKDFLPPELLEEFKANSVDGCIAVQADQSEDESLFLLELAEKYDFIKGVVGWVDLRTPHLEARLEYFSQFKKLSGFRHVVQDEPDPKFLLQEDFIAGLKLLKKHNFTYDILIFPHQLGASLEVVKQLPDQAFVIDHIAKPYIKAGYIEAWSKMIKAIAQYPNVHCKISGMVTEAHWQNWKYEDYAPYLDIVTEAFGIDRLMYGSDWPVCLLSGTYREVKGIAERYFQSFSEREQALFWGGNAEGFYRTGVRGEE